MGPPRGNVARAHTGIGLVATLARFYEKQFRHFAHVAGRRTDLEPPFSEHGNRFEGAGNEIA